MVIFFPVDNAHKSFNQNLPLQLSANPDGLMQLKRIVESKRLSLDIGMLICISLSPDDGMSVHRFSCQTPDGAESMYRNDILDSIPMQSELVSKYWPGHPALAMLMSLSNEGRFEKIRRYAKSGALEDLVRALSAIQNEDVSDAGEDINTCDSNGYSALHYSSIGGHLGCIQALLCTPSVESNVCSPVTGVTPLIAAANVGKSDCVAALLADPRVEPNATGLRGRGALHCAALHGHESAVRVLIGDPRVAVDLKDEQGRYMS